jgi:signal transduction histidine kinase
LKRSITLENKLTLSYRDSVFSFEFAALDYSIPEKNQYAYKMEGFDKEWVFSGNRNLATYTNLDHGDYTFRVKGSNNDGIWNEEGKSIKIHITPPYWKTVWFKGLSLLAVIGTAGSIYKSKLDKVRKEKEQQEEFARQLIDIQESDRKRISSELHDSVGQDLMITKNRLLLTKNHSEDKEFISRSISEASELISNTLSDIREISYALHPYQIERLGLSKAIMSIIDRASKSTEIVFTKHIDRIDKLIPPEAEISLYRIMQECMTNVIKHSNAKEVFFNANKGSNEISIMISDNGIGFDTDKLKAESGKHCFGLFVMGERVKLINGKFRIESKPGHGTTIYVNIPYTTFSKPEHAEAVNVKLQKVAQKNTIK